VIYVATEANMPIFRAIQDVRGSPPRSITSSVLKKQEED